MLRNIPITSLHDDISLWLGLSIPGLAHSDATICSLVKISTLDHLSQHHVSSIVGSGLSLDLEKLSLELLILELEMLLLVFLLEPDLIIPFDLCLCASAL